MLKPKIAYDMAKAANGNLRGQLYMEKEIPFLQLHDHYSAYN